MSAAPPSSLQEFLDAAARRDGLHWYAIADSAQAPALPAAVHEGTRALRCLFGAEQETPLAAAAPHLVELPAPGPLSSAWDWILSRAPRAPCVTVLATPLAFDAAFALLQAATEVLLPDDDAMFFGYWDPAILGTLVGQPDDATLHVPGPVLDPQQRQALTCALAGWWYWDRDGHRHALEIAPDCTGAAPLPLALTQAQVDQLVEASMPDHVLYFVDLNQRHLLERIEGDRYRYVRAAYLQARALGLEGMRDLVNFVCVKIVYGARFETDPAILALLQSVREGRIGFEDAVRAMP